MKYIKLILLVFVWNAAAQDQPSVNDFNFESSTNPAFTLLGESPTDINTPDNLKALGVYVSNGFSNTNIALELNPYWLMDFEQQRSYRGFRGIKKNKKGEDYIDPFIGLKNNSSFTLGYINKKFEGFDEDKKVAAIGVRTTILQFYNQERLNKIKTVIQRVETGVTNEINVLFQDFIDGSEDGPDLGSGSCEAIDTDNTIKEKYLKLADQFLQRARSDIDPDDPDDLAEEIREALARQGKELISNEELVKLYIDEHCPIINAFGANRKTIKPVFRLDGSLGYSVLFKENEINTSTASRFGSWLTADFAVRFNDKNYLNLYAIGKYIDDGFNLDMEGNYFTNSFWDVGGKIELEFNKFKFSYEYLNRTNDDERFRSVGNLSYQVNSKIVITGGFGRDFPVEDNLVTLLGINWGLNLNGKTFTSR